MLRFGRHNWLILTEMILEFASALLHLERRGLLIIYVLITNMKRSLFVAATGFIIYVMYSFVEINGRDRKERRSDSSLGQCTGGPEGGGATCSDLQQ